MAADTGEGRAVSDNFYRSFEERYYAPREVIKSLRRQYLPFVESLASIYPGGNTFDLGCGRGEWLELMSEQGLTPFGVDLDAGMLQACQERGLPAIQGDAIAHLQSLASDSQVLVSAFHVVEHITFDQLRTVVSEALRVLRPGGLLILETPNPENIVVATNNFYLDPTHQKPIPSLLLSFVVEHGGFETVKTLRLQESPALHSSDHAVTLLDVIRGASPDYAVIAQKTAGPDVAEQFSQLFAADYGLSLEQLAGRYEARTDFLQSRLEKVEASILFAEAQHQHTKNQLHDIEAQIRHAEAQARRANAQVEAVYRSTSWRVTAPMRWVSLALKGKGFKLIKPSLKTWIQRGARYAKQRPWLHGMAVAVLDCMPRVKARLVPVVAVASQRVAVDAAIAPLSIDGLNEHAARIHTDLITAFEQSQREKN